MFKLAKILCYVITLHMETLKIIGDEIPKFSKCDVFGTAYYMPIEPVVWCQGFWMNYRYYEWSVFRNNKIIIYNNLRVNCAFDVIALLVLLVSTHMLIQSATSSHKTRPLAISSCQFCRGLTHRWTVVSWWKCPCLWSIVSAAFSSSRLMLCCIKLS